MRDGRPAPSVSDRKQGQWSGLAHLAGRPAKSRYSVTALSTDTDTPGPMVELSAIFFM